MRKQSKALAKETAGWLRELSNIDWNPFSQVTTKLKNFGPAVLVPVIIGIVVLRLVWGAAFRIILFFFPPSPCRRHLQARYLYRKGRIDDACYVWNELVSVERGIFFGPSALSLACHEIYINHEYQKGLFILKQAQQRQQQFLSSSGDLSKKIGQGSTGKTRTGQNVLRMNRKKVDAMIMDAEAYLQGDGVMVERMNAPQAKLEHLGISTSDETMDSATNTKDGILRRRIWK